MITVYQAQGSNVTPLADARLYVLLSGGGTGVVLGCEITILGGLQLRVGAGWVLIQGRCIAIDEETITVTPSTGAQVDGQLLLHLDVGSDDAPGTWVTNAETPLPAPVQEDVNGSGTIYELQMCTYKVDQLQVTDLKTTYPVLGTAASYLYKATFDVDGWAPGSGSVSQTVAMTPVDGGPPITAGSTLLACVGYDRTLPDEAKQAMQGPAAKIAAADATLGAGTISVTLDSAPSVDVELYFLAKQGVEPVIPPLAPIGGSVQINLLWENPTPTEIFGPQSISVNLSSYDHVIIVATNYLGDYSAPSVLCKIGDGGMISSPYYTIRSRFFTTNVSGVDFQSGYSANQYGVAPTEANGVCVPKYIYGVKL